MYAIVEIAGKQYKVRENDKLIVPRLSGDVDDTVTFDRVLLFANGDDDVRLGTPLVPDASVTATIVEHVKGDKVLVFRKKRRKRFKVKRGHRQPYTRIEVSGLSADGSTAKTEKETTKKTAANKSAKAAEKPEKPEFGAEADADAKSGKSAAKAGAAAKTADAPAEAGKAKTKAKADVPDDAKDDAAPKSTKSAKAAASDEDSAEDKAAS